jgi:hypothetical protein
MSISTIFLVDNNSFLGIFNLLINIFALFISFIVIATETSMA